ncbi:hypothetical protein P7K49_006886, partial [Saguinus oedipus]
LLAVHPVHYTLQLVRFQLKIAMIIVCGVIVQRDQKNGKQLDYYNSGMRENR